MVTQRRLGARLPRTAAMSGAGRLLAHRAGWCHDPREADRTQPTAWLASLLCTSDTEREQNCPTSAKAAKAEGENLAQADSLACSCCSHQDSAHKTLALPHSDLCKSMV